MKKGLFNLIVSDRVVVATLVTIIVIALMAVCFTSCTRDDDPAAVGGSMRIVAEQPDTSDYAVINFICQGDFTLSTTPMTRSLMADGKAMTDIWVIDYLNGMLTQQLHQTSDNEDFGTPTLNLSVGSHHVYFIASRGKTPTLNTDAHTLTFGSVSDTFYKDYAIDVTGTSNGSRTVTLDRCVTKLTAVITDEIPTGAATFNITPTAWHYGIDYVSGNPTAATASQTITINIPSSEIGVTGEHLNIFGFSADDEWTTDIALDCKTSGGDILGTATIAAAPFQRNRITIYSGPLFSAEGLTTVSLSTEWLDAHTGTW